MNLQDLQDLYRQEMNRLHRQLIEGVDWERTAHQRHYLGAVHREIYRRLNPAQFGDPAASFTRRDQSNPS